MLLDVRCPGCQAAYLRLRSPICHRCVDGFGPAVQFCLPEIDGGVAAALHEGLPRRIVLAGKGGGRSPVFSQLARCLVLNGLAGVAAAEASLITWVPASPAKRRERGYDQGEILANALARGLGLQAKNLFRRSVGAGQTGRNREQRQKGPELSVKRRFVASSVLVVDDVVTTGASIAAAATLLRAGGASEVRALTLTTRLLV